MKFIRLIGLLVFIGCATTVRSQGVSHFIYLQSDTKQPFFVKLSPGADPLNSSGSGYLILPQVPQGSFSFWVGFPDKSYPEQHFVCTVGSDKGFLLKHFPEKGWALYDLQELTLTYTAGTDSAAHATPPPVDTTGKGQPQGTSAAETPAAPVSTPQIQTATAPETVTAPQTQTAVAPTTAPDTTPIAPVRDTPAVPKPADAFGDALVAVTQDTTLRDVKKIVKKDPPPVQPAPVQPTPVQPAPAPAVTPANIVLVSRQVTDTAVQLIYADRQSSGAVDTVQVLMNQTAPVADTPTAAPAVTTAAAAPAVTPPQTTSPDTTTAKSVATIDTPAATPAITPVDTTRAFNPATLAKGGKAKDTSNLVVPVFKQQQQDTDSSRGSLAAGFGIQPTTPAAPATTAAATGGGNKDLHLANANCNRVAGDEDYQRLRKKMASETDVDRMIELARKAFKKTCFTTDQLRSLSFLFLQEDGRYKFIEEAYPFVSDSWNFNSLQNLFSSVYYVNRFKALVQH
ncbi:MAG TPA: DUF4476 domain-containing protein [Dinghuibacter sp.]|uniref:DUF4476 domain-containing protein n=1 Tax=Dinghuibacter sp. TaxID=2024697 RepID=UPI002CB243E1|nr:DUF4476 domain-containing protein [Dinghuibacter sp.]HTJ10560.1 DUF4476 domain-containing protein [Dinghuibacter sp.]